MTKYTLKFKETEKMNKFEQFITHIPKDEWDKMSEEAQKVAINQIVAFEVVVGQNKSYLLPIGNKEGFKRKDKTKRNLLFFICRITSSFVIKGCKTVTRYFA